MCSYEGFKENVNNKYYYTTMSKCSESFLLNASRRVCISRGKTFYCPKGVNPGDLTPLDPEAVSFLEGWLNTALKFIANVSS